MNTLELSKFGVYCEHCASDNVEVDWWADDFGSEIRFECLSCNSSENKYWDTDSKKWIDS
jgi:transposase-like protein